MKIAQEAKQFNVAVMGRRWGKSLFCRDRVIHPMLKGQPTAWFAPNNKTLADSWREMKTALLPITVEKSEDEHRIEVLGGGSVEMWSLESDSAGRSRKYAKVVIDEAAMVPKLDQFWMENILPTLTDYNGEAWIVSTPRGYNFFKTLFDNGQDPLNPDWKSWQLPTSTNPHIGRKFLDNVRAQMTEAAYNQEYLALFVNWEGSVFRNVSDCATAQPLDGPVAQHEYVIGVDWGRSRDYTVFTVIDRMDRKMVALDRSNKVDYALQRGRLAALRDTWKPVEIVAESNSIGQPIIEQLEKDGIRIRSFQTTNASKNQAIEQLALAFERREIQVFNDPILLGELQAFQGEQLPSGMIRYSAAGNSHDDTVMSLSMAWTEVASPLTLGFLDYAKEEKLVNKVQSSGMMKPQTSAASVRCPRCESHAVIRVQGSLHCNQCGNDVFEEKGPEPLRMTFGNLTKAQGRTYGGSR